MIYIFFIAAVILTAWFFYYLGYNISASSAIEEINKLKQGMIVLAKLINDMQSKLNEYGIEFDNDAIMDEEIENGRTNT